MNRGVNKSKFKNIILESKMYFGVTVMDRQTDKQNLIAPSNLEMWCAVNSNIESHEYCRQGTS